MRQCSHCRQFKPLTEFYQRYQRTSPHSACKTCTGIMAHQSRVKQRHGLEIQSAIMAELQKHGPLSTGHLAAGVRQRLNNDAIKITGYVIAQNAARLDLVDGTPRKNHGSIWRIIGDPRYQAMPQRRKCYVTNIGMDAENLAWMAEQQAMTAKRTQRGNIQDFAAAVLNQRVTA